MTRELPTPANGAEDPWTELFGASLALEEARDIDQITAVIKDVQKVFPEPVDPRPEAYPLYAVHCLLGALLDAIARLPK